MSATTSFDSDNLRSPLMPAEKEEEQSKKLCIDEMLQLKHFVLTNLAWSLEACHFRLRRRRIQRL
ncbi:hypothetical protein TanjilG_30879 [Lupinus angustifolius]|uniref:Uncharacterized protein n=1 Tax=Lupinus angustifolius TaxID=3871 RepID=A0A394D980_LUPAN|nr:hypothetical protein TanjilG_30879 [Lupinus angustifolius]